MSLIKLIDNLWFHLQRWHPLVSGIWLNPPRFLQNDHRQVSRCSVFDREFRSNSMTSIEYPSSLIWSYQNFKKVSLLNSNFILRIVVRLTDELWINPYLNMADVPFDANVGNSMDLIPPGQESPQHILNVLDNFCIQSIFRYLTNL